MSEARSIGLKHVTGTPIWTAPLQDREILMAGEDHVSFTAYNAQTANVGASVIHILGAEGTKFDKIAGGVHCGILAADRVVDLSRFIASDHLEVLFNIPALANIINVELTLGTDAVNSMTWTILVAAMVAGWNNWQPHIYEGVTNGNGWDPSDVRFVQLVVEFGAAGDALADMILNHVCVKSV